MSGEDRPESPEAQATIRLASLGIELALRELDEVRPEQDIVVRKVGANLLSSKEVDREMGQLRRRYFLIGGDLWRWQRKRLARFDGAAGRLLDLNKSCGGMYF